MLSIDEAIMSEMNQHEFSDYNNYHKQIAEWLERLKVYESDDFTDDLLNMGFTKGYNKAIDDFAEKLLSQQIVDKSVVRRVKEQLKAGVDNGT